MMRIRSFGYEDISDDVMVEFAETMKRTQSL